METLAVKIENIVMTYQGKDILEIDSLTAYQGDVIGVIGGNGTGKSTLMKLIAGDIEPHVGSVQRQVDFNYLAQNQEIEESYRADVLQADILSRLQVPMNVVESLSGGEAHKFRIAQVLSVYKLGLLLDEPTTHLDKESIDFLIEELRYYYGTLIIVSHDRYFLNQLANKIWEVDGGQVCEYIGNYEAYEQAKDVQLKQQEEAYRNYEREKVRLEKAVAQKAHQAQKTAQVSSKQRGKSIKPDRLSSSKQKDTVQKNLHKSAKAIEKRLDQLESVEATVKDRPIEFPPIEHLEMHNHFPIMGYNIQLQKGNKTLLDGANFQFPLGKTIAIVGPNGVGKSTLLNHILANGEGITLSPKVVFGVYQQLDYQLREETALLTYLLKYTEFEESLIRAILSKLGFEQSQLMTPLSRLSGGEATRVAMAEMFVKPSNVLILDEPTNFIDILTMKALEGFIQAYPGTILVTSHDQDFITNIADHIYRFEDHQLHLLS